MERNKKGQFIEGIVFTVVLTLFAIVFVIYGFIVPNIATALNNTGNFNNNYTQMAIAEYYDSGTTQLNFAFMILFGGLVLVQLFSSFLVRYHPIFLVIYMFMAFLNGFIAIYMGNMFDQFSQISTFSSVFQQQTALSWVMGHLLTVSIIVDVLTMIVIFAKVGEFRP